MTKEVVNKDKNHSIVNNMNDKGALLFCIHKFPHFLAKKARKDAHLRNP